MKVSYLGYYLRPEPAIRVKYDLRPIVAAFADSENVPLHSSFKEGSEFLLLRRAPLPNFYLFVMTKNAETVKKINIQDLTLEELQEMLGRDGQIGFASYVYVGEDYFSMASTLLAPRLRPFSEFMSRLLRIATGSNLEFCAKPLTRALDREDALHMDHITRTTVELAPEHDCWEDIKALFNVPVNDDSMLAGISISFMGKKRKSIKQDMIPLIQNLSGDGLAKFDVRAKLHMEDSLVNYMLLDMNKISDEISSKEATSDVTVVELMTQRREQNATMAEALDEFRNETFAEVDGDLGLGGFDTPAAWNAVVLGQHEV